MSIMALREDDMAEESYVFDEWRRMALPEQMRFLSEAMGLLVEGLALGDEIYHSSVDGFQGSPIDHGKKETRDSLVYWHWAGREHDALVEENRILRSRVAELERQQCPCCTAARWLCPGAAAVTD